jgi:predicted CXXCH cytochrome family protein
MDVATDDTVLGAFDGRTLEHDGVTTTFRRDGEAFVVRTDGADGALADFQVTHVFGAVPLQQYLVSFPDGRKQVLRQAWDTRPEDEGGQRWFALYPDQHIGPDDLLHWTRPTQTWNHQCAECHSTDLVKGYDAGNDTYETTYAEIDVSCEACHGPGSEHVAWAEELGDAYDPFEHEVGGLTVDLRAPEREWEIDPATGTAIVVKRTQPSKQIETCARCHSRRGQIGAQHVDGRTLLQSHRLALLTDALYHPDGQILDEVFVHGSFLQSKMYGAGVECTDCHDAHSMQLREPGNALCNQCHDATKFDVKEHHFHEPGTEGAACVDCHMRTETYMVVDPRRDHSLRVPRPDLTLSLGVPNACDDCHADKGTQWSVDAVERWYGEKDRALHPGEVIAFGRRGGPGAAEALARLAGDRDVANIVRATALSLLARSPGHPVVRRAVEEAAGDPDPVVRHGAVRALVAVPPEQRLSVGAPLLRDDVLAVRIDAARELLTPEPIPHTDEVRGDLAAALEELRAAEELHLDQAQSRVALGNIALVEGDVAAAEEHYRKAIAVDDAYMPAYVNLADVLREQQRDGEGEKVLREGLARYPDDPVLLYAYSMLLIRTGRRSEALEPLSRAAEAQADARTEMAHALLVQELGEPDRALELLDEAAERHPGSSELISTLLGAQMQRGDLEGALGSAEHLLRLRPDDPRLQRVVRELRARTPGDR